MRLNELITDIGVQVTGQLESEIRGLTADSRKVEPGFVFAALRGTALDGAHFIPDAIQAGATAILCDPGTVMTDQGTVSVLEAANPRQALARMAARFYPDQPETIIAVTGTNGKTSVVSFLRQIWAKAGHNAAALGTVGVTTDRGTTPLSHTTPDPVELHKQLSQLARQGVTHLAFEASSHGLEQYRVDGIRIAHAAFTNISRDHLDYHASFEDYFAAKARLFTKVMNPQGVSVIDVDSADAKRMAELAREQGRRIFTVGAAGQDLKLLDCVITGNAQTIKVQYEGAINRLSLPLIGAFQVSNALVAAGLALVSGGDRETVFAALETIIGARGRLEKVTETPVGGLVFVDYAHTPDALAAALDALRPHVKQRLIVIFGCGGDRDTGKRPQMGRIAVEKSDSVIVTDDNPRTENATAIRAEIMTAAQGAREIGDRAEAIQTAVNELQAGDILLVAGKGHETGQIVGEKIIPFSDHQEIEKAVSQLRAGVL